MNSLLRHELFKLCHRKLTWWIISLLFLFMLLMGIAMRNDYHDLLIMTCFNSSIVIMLILIIVGSTIFSMEFQNRTILSVIYHSDSRVEVFVAKFITLFIYNLFLHLVAIVFTIIFSLTPIMSKPVSWSSIYQYHQALWINMLTTTGIDIISSTLIISLICLTSCIINSNAWVIVVNGIIIFMGAGFSSNLLMAKVITSSVIRWNPFNMLNLTQQYYNYGSYYPVTLLSNNQLLLGTICYSILFIVCGYYAFKHKKF